MSAPEGQSVLPRPIRAVLLACILLISLMAFAGPAGAETQVITKKVGPIQVGPYQVALGGPQAPGGPAPKVPNIEGFITRMSVDVVDVNTGKPVPIKRIMLHHIVFFNVGTAEARRFDPFYGDGEERAKMVLPEGYGYPIHPGEQWGWVWMLMNHQSIADQVQIRYRMTVVTGEELKPVSPLSSDASCRRLAIAFGVPGGVKPGSVDVRKMERPIPVAGRLVAGLGHVHGGAKGLILSQPACQNRPLYRSKPTWGKKTHPFYQVRPVLHEPGPINMSQFTSEKGIPVAAGETLRLTSRYDNQVPPLPRHGSDGGLPLARPHGQGDALQQAATRHRGPEDETQRPHQGAAAPDQHLRLEQEGHRREGGRSGRVARVRHRGRNRGRR